MIKYHILSLLALAIIAIAGIEAAAEFYEQNMKEKGSWYLNTKAWVMTAVTLTAIYLYFRARVQRKKETLNNSKK